MNPLTLFEAALDGIELKILKRDPAFTIHQRGDYTRRHVEVIKDRQDGITVFQALTGYNFI